MLQTADYTTGQTHLRRIPDTHTVQRFVQHEIRTVIHHDISVALEGMSFFDGLQSEWVVQRHLDLKVTRCIGLQRTACPLNHHTVQQQIGIAYRDRGHAIEHTAAQTNRGDIIELDRLRYRVAGIERDNSRRHGRVVVLERSIGARRDNAVVLAGAVQ